MKSTKNVKIFIWVLVVCVFIGTAFTAYGYFFGNMTSSNFSCATAAKKPIIVAFGDSLVAGYGAPEQQGFLGPLSTKIGTPIINLGESGDTTAQALTRLPAVLSQHPDIVIVLLGGNDALQQIPLATTQQNLDQILSTLMQQHIQIVLVGVLGGFPIDPFASMFQKLAVTYKTEYVPDILSGLITNQKYMYDEVHPNAAGYDIVAGKIYPALNHACENFNK